MAVGKAKEFYNSKAWRLTRKTYAQSVCYLCEICGRPGDIVHHRTWLNASNIDNFDLTLGWDNLQYVCQDCHNKIHFERSEVANRQRVSFIDGKPCPPLQNSMSEALTPVVNPCFIERGFSKNV